MSLYMKHNYTNKNIEIIRNTTIREYDIKSAGLNIIHNKGFITDDEYNALLNMEKLQRNIVIGKWLRENKSVNAVMMKEFIEIRKVFIQENEISDDEILSIKKDALFLVDKEAKVLDIMGYTFVPKDVFTDYFKIFNIEFYYNKYTDDLVVKGMREEVRECQDDVYFKLIKELLKLGKNKKKIFELLIEFKDDYLELRLSKEYYRSVLSNYYIFKLKGVIRCCEDIPEDMLPYIEIDDNLAFINSIIKLFV